MADEVLNVKEIKASLVGIANAKEIEYATEQGLEKISGSVEIASQQIFTATREAKEDVKNTADEYIPLMEQYHSETEQFMLDAEQYRDEAFSGTPEGYQTLVGNVNSLSDTIVESADWLKSKNLIDITKAEQGNLDNTEGKPTASTSNGRSSNFIEVSGNTSYTLSANKVLYAMRLYEYDANKNFVKRTALTNLQKLTITTDANTKFVKWTVNIDNSTIVTQGLMSDCKLMLNEGTEALPYVPFSKSNVELTNEITSAENNGFISHNLAKITVGANVTNNSDNYYLSGGSLFDASYALAIPMPHITDFTISLDVKCKALAILYLYDDGSYDSEKKNVNSADAYTHFSFHKITSKTVKSIRIGIFNDSDGNANIRKNTLNINKGSIEMPYTEYALSNAQLFDEIANLQSATERSVNVGANISLHTTSKVVKNGKIVSGAIRISALADIPSASTLVTLQDKPIIATSYLMGINTSNNSVMPLILANNTNQIALFGSNTIPNGTTLIIPINYVSE